MPTELFKIASEIYEEPEYQVKRRKKIALGALVGCIVFVALGLYELRDFANTIPFYESFAIRENQVVLIKVSSWFLSAISALFLALASWTKLIWISPLCWVTIIIEMSLVIFSDLHGYQAFHRKIISSAYAGLFISLCVLLISAVALLAGRNKPSKD